jgi:hypothetical protein
MKKILFAFTVLVYTLLIATSGKAQDKFVPPAVTKSFNEHFKNAQLARWTPIHNSYVACYSEGQGYKDAFFTEEGEFKGIGRFITVDLSPMNVQSTLNNSYRGYEIIELYQFDCVEDGLCYFAVLKNQKHEVILKLDGYGDVSYTKKNKIKTSTSAAEPMIASKDNKENKTNK